MAVVMPVKWTEVQTECEKLVKRMKKKEKMRGRPFDGVYGIPTGGSIVAAIVSSLYPTALLDEPSENCFVVDDIRDSGKTLRKIMAQDHGPFNVDTIFQKRSSCATIETGGKEVEVGTYLSFPWERDGLDAEDIGLRLLQFIGENPAREGLVETPKRFAKAMQELTIGYCNKDGTPDRVLGKTFTSDNDQMIVVKNVPFWSLCEHHILPFHGKCSVGYVPEGGKVVGLSKIPRLIEAISRRLQIQERMTQEIAEYMTKVSPHVGVVVSATHTCMAMRGVRSEGEMITSCMKGEFLYNQAARQEFLHMIKE